MKLITIEETAKKYKKTTKELLKTTVKLLESTQIDVKLTLTEEK